MESRLYYRLYRIRHLSLSWARSIQVTPSEKISSRLILSNIILPSTPISSKWSFPSVSPLKSCVHPSLLPYRAICSVCLFHQELPGWYTRVILGEEYKSWSTSLCRLFLYPVIYSVIGPSVLLSTLFSIILCLRSSFSMRDQVSDRISQQDKLYVLLYVLIRIILKQTAKQKTLDRKVADIPRFQSALNFFMNAKCEFTENHLCYSGISSV